MIEYACYRDGTDLTDLVEDARRTVRSTTTVFMLSGETPSRETIDQRLAERPPKSPVILQVDPDELHGDEAERAGEIVRMVAQSEQVAQQQPPADWTVPVTCPLDGCVNVFSSTTAKDEPGSVTKVKVVGHPPTIEEQAMLDAAKELSPDKSLQHADDAAKYVISNMTLIALVAGGFGIFGSANGGFDQHPGWYTGIVVAAAASLGCALIAVFPWVKTGRNYNDLRQVATDYQQAIKHRALWARLATVALGASLLCALIVFLLPSPANPSATITASWDGSGAKLYLTAKADTSALPNESRTEVDISGLTKQGTLVPLTTSTGHSAKSGSLNVEVKTAAQARFAAYRVLSRIGWDKRSGGGYSHQRVDTVKLTPPPFAVSTGHGKGQTDP